MNNTIEFVLRMRDMMSSNITKVSSTSTSAFNRMNQSANQMTGRNKVLGMSFSELQSKIRQVEDVISKSTIPSQIAEARRELTKLQQQAVSHPGNVDKSSNPISNGLSVGKLAIGNALGAMVTGGVSMIAGGIKSGIGEMISQSMAKEQAITGLTTFLGKKGATDAYKNIRQDANVTPFDTASLLEVNRALISAGANAKDARRDSLNLANAVSAVGGGNDVLSRMAANMQQIKTVGKATAMDIRQFGIAGINIYEMLARSTGKNINQVKEMDVTYEQLQKALAMSAGKGGIYEGAMEAQSKTMSGKWATVQDNFKTAASDLGDAFSPVINKLLDLGIKFANSIAPGLELAKPYIDMISNGVSALVDNIMGIVNGTSEWSEWLDIAKSNLMISWNAIKYMGLKLWELVSKIVEFIKKSEILKDIFKVIGWIIEKVGNIIGFVIDSMIWLWDNVLEPILSKIEAVYKWIKGTNTVHVKSSHTLLTPKKPKEEDTELGKNTALATSNASAGASAGDTVSGAGPKVINIHVGKFFDNLQFTTLNTGESANEIEKIVMECFARVVYNGSKMI